MAPAAFCRAALLLRAALALLLLLRAALALLLLEMVSCCWLESTIRAASFCRNLPSLLLSYPGLTSLVHRTEHILDLHWWQNCKHRAIYWKLLPCQLLQEDAAREKSKKCTRRSFIAGPEKISDTADALNTCGCLWIANCIVAETRAIYHQLQLLP